MNFPVYIEFVSISNLIQVSICLFRISIEHSQPLSVFYFDGDAGAVSILRSICKLKHWNFCQLVFRAFNIREENSGDLIRLCIPHDYIWSFKKEIEAVIIKKSNPNIYTEAQRAFTEKFIVSESLIVPGSLSRSIFLIHVVKNELKIKKYSDAKLLLHTRPWWKLIGEYAKSVNIELSFIKSRLIVDRVSTVRNSSMRNRFKLWLSQSLKIYFPAAFNLVKNFSLRIKGSCININNDDYSAKIAVQGTDNFHFENDGINSDIFFSLQSTLPTRSLLLLINNITEEKISRLKKSDVKACLLRKKTPKEICLPYYLGASYRNSVKYKTDNNISTWENKQLRYLSYEYHSQKAFWKELFIKNRIKVFTSWFKYKSKHIPITEAIREIGGVSTIWQWAFESDPRVETVTYADISFRYSNKTTSYNSETKVNYHITTGFLKDYCFQILKPKSVEYRIRLMRNGCTKIVTVLDENSINDSRWHLGHELQRKHYEFWSTKVLENPWLGVIFKPKAPHTLFKRLGDKAEILKQAEKTGRCIVLGTIESQVGIPVSMAAMASDLAIHGDLSAGTAGVESALTGTPTVLLDYEGWSRSQLYNLGEGRVVFKNYESLWDILIEHWNSKNSVPGFGDWSPILDDLDPFRDGRAAERMGTYLHWLIEGFDQGLDREIVLADAADRYSHLWGSDKVKINNP